ncbi:conserved hypothetical protein [Sulfurimonas autotrophica DSM 16294]|uniref:DUF4381 domain-containing protein n=1 Tax=Sulfurimonas autotrophica (strain ATCC BAA-671 / DSM 16294 / JCM 11897 / OK10) TaxID=563040 RepID=E0URY8_SULAO|nr:conserved hypothetical protein [Sulfurimonas autotrophica DSM 16294]
MKQLNINDIFPLETVPDNSLSLFLLSLVLCVVIVLILYFFYKKRVQKNKKDEAYYLNILLHSNFYNVKQSAYLFTYYGRRLAKTKEQKKELESIISQLYIYKYQQKSLNIPEKLQKEIRKFLDELRDFYA